MPFRGCLVPIVVALGHTIVLQAQNPGGRGQGLASSDTCGTPAPLPHGERPERPMFPNGAYPISLPAISPTGVCNDLPVLSPHDSPSSSRQFGRR